AAVNWRTRGAIHLEQGEYDRAITDYSEAIRLDPESSWAFNDRGLAWYENKEFERAIADYGEAIRLDPQDSDPVENRSLAWLGLRQFDRARQDATGASELTGWTNPDTITHLATVCAESGNFAQAVTRQEQALSLLKSADSRDDLEARLAAYKQSKP